MVSYPSFERVEAVVILTEEEVEEGEEGELVRVEQLASLVVVVARNQLQEGVKAQVDNH